ncbi:MAG: class II glutamine amidotransferase [Methylobacterium sp.]|nr:class II glutamine amidotransferase [Methylobacterium sp.]
MCRFLAYQGDPIPLVDLVCAPTNSLVQQSRYAQEGKTRTNGDGFGLGWYGTRAEPERHRMAGPAWADENLTAISKQVSSHLFFAHVRAATGTETTQANCHPFAYGRWLFMHNGQIGAYGKIRPLVETMISKNVRYARAGTTDSEAIFLAAFGNGIACDPVQAMTSTLYAIRALMIDAGITEPLRFSAVLTDGVRLYAFRWASDGKPPRLYYRQTAGRIVLASEPLDHLRAAWRELPNASALLSSPGRSLAMRHLADLPSQLAA